LRRDAVEQERARRVREAAGITGRLGEGLRLKKAGFQRLGQLCLGGVQIGLGAGAVIGAQLELLRGLFYDALANPAAFRPVLLQRAQRAGAQGDQRQAGHGGARRRRRRAAIGQQPAARGRFRGGFGDIGGQLHGAASLQ
jgi:hypothetical protein